MPDVVCLGQFTADVVVTHADSLPEKGKAIFVDDITLNNGGCACNTAVALSKLGINTAVIGKVGCDTFGDYLIKVMAAIQEQSKMSLSCRHSKSKKLLILLAPVISSLRDSLQQLSTDGT